MTQAVLKHSVTELEFKSGIDREYRESLADKLSRALSDTYRLLINTQIVHWNAQGPLFFSVHKLTENQYEVLFDRIDAIAERIRALGMPAPRSAANLFEKTRIKDFSDDLTLEKQLRELVGMNEQATAGLRETIQLAEKAGDVKTADLLTDTIGDLEEASWMLRATFAERTA